MPASALVGAHTSTFFPLHGKKGEIPLQISTASIDIMKYKHVADEYSHQIVPHSTPRIRNYERQCIPSQFYSAHDHNAIPASFLCKSVYSRSRYFKKGHAWACY